MSCQPSLSESRKAQPAPIVSGRYFLPNAPLLCLKRMPASAVTSVNSIAPEGRGGVGLAVGDGVAAVAVSGFCGVIVAGCLQPQMKTAKRSRTKVENVFMQRGTLEPQPDA